MSLQPQMTALVEAVSGAASGSTLPLNGGKVVSPSNGAGPSGTTGSTIDAQPAPSKQLPEAVEATDDDDDRSPSPALTVSNGPNSPKSPSTYPESLAPTSSSAFASPNATTASSISHAASATPAPPAGASTLAPSAEIGLGSLQGEDQLKNALSSKDRLFLILVSKEMEAFVATAIEHENEGTEPNSSSFASYILPYPDLRYPRALDNTPTSTYQRMLVYKAAEWYGLKAVPGPEGTMLLGVLGSLDCKAVDLQLATLVPRAASPPQQFRIMLRAPGNGDVSRSTSASGEDGENGEGSSSSTKIKTLEEKQLAYKLARRRIYGDDEEAEEEPSAPSSTVSRRTENDDEPDPVPRHTYSGDFEVPYPSLYNLPKDRQTTPGPANVGTSAAAYAYPSTGGVSYPVYPQYQGMAYPAQHQQHSQALMPPPHQGQHQGGGQYMSMDAYINGGGAYLGHMGQPGGYGIGVWQQQQMAQGPSGSNGAVGWTYPNGAPLVPGHGMMPSITQGMPYNPPAPFTHIPTQHQHQQHQQHHLHQYPQHPSAAPPPAGPIPQPHQPMYQQTYQTHQPAPQPSQSQSQLPLVQPTPVRPGMHPHSSASSSMSSRSYGDGQSRPHSRGSTTSTRSAASSVRLGVMYPTGGQHGYRQKPLKGQGGAFTGMTSLGAGETRRGRGQSPSQASTTSSRSSRKASSINITQPQAGQHPLPQRPDWAANNVPYHPSPMPNPGGSGPGSVTGASEASQTDFPPLARNGTNAEPMQVEKAKSRGTGSSGGSSSGGGGGGGAVSAGGIRESLGSSRDCVWNGASRNGQPLAGDTIRASRVNPPPVSVAIPTRQSPQTSHVQPPPPNPSKTPGPPPSQQDLDPDFPRRMPSSRTLALFDPSAPRPSTSAQGHNHGQNHGQTPGASPVNHSRTPISSTPTPVMSAPAGGLASTPIVPQPLSTGIPSPSTGTAPSGPSGPGNHASPVSAISSTTNSAAAVSSSIPSSTSESASASSVSAPGSMIEDDVIEARLAAVSLSSGVSIGPPVRPPTSYAKVVRRD